MYFSMGGVILRRVIGIICVIFILTILALSIPCVKDCSGAPKGFVLGKERLELESLLDSYEHAMQSSVDVQQAKIYLQSHIPKLKKVSENMFRLLGLGNGSVTETLSSLVSSCSPDIHSFPSVLYQTIQIVFQNFFHSDS
jgi:hypothetical protein